jgi:hypothetical protein
MFSFAREFSSKTSHDGGRLAKTRHIRTRRPIMLGTRACPAAVQGWRPATFGHPLPLILVSHWTRPAAGGCEHWGCVPCMAILSPIFGFSTQREVVAANRARSKGSMFSLAENSAHGLIVSAWLSVTVGDSHRRPSVGQRALCADINIRRREAHPEKRLGIQHGASLGADAAEPGSWSGNAANLRRCSVRWHALPSRIISCLIVDPPSHAAQSPSLHGAHTRLRRGRKSREIRKTHITAFSLWPCRRRRSKEPASPQRSVSRKVEPKARQRRHQTGARQNFSGC